MSSPVGHMAHPHALRLGDRVLWRQGTGHGAPTVVLTPKSTKRITVEGAEPFYRGSQGGPDADFTHVVIEFHGLPFPCIFGAGDTLLGWSETFRGSD